MMNKKYEPPSVEYLGGGELPYTVPIFAAAALVLIYAVAIWDVAAAVNYAAYMNVLVETFAWIT